MEKRREEYLINDGDTQVEIDYKLNNVNFYDKIVTKEKEIINIINIPIDTLLELAEIIKNNTSS